MRMFLNYKAKCICQWLLNSRITLLVNYSCLITKFSEAMDICVLTALGTGRSRQQTRNALWIELNLVTGHMKILNQGIWNSTEPLLAMASPDGKAGEMRPFFSLTTPVPPRVPGSNQAPFLLRVSELEGPSAARVHIPGSATFQCQPPPPSQYSHHSAWLNCDNFAHFIFLGESVSTPKCRLFYLSL